MSEQNGISVEVERARALLTEEWGGQPPVSGHAWMDLIDSYGHTLWDAIPWEATLGVEHRAGLVTIAAMVWEAIAAIDRRPMPPDRAPCPWCGAPIVRPVVGFVICGNCGTRWDWDYDWTQKTSGGNDGDGGRDAARPAAG